ncbi:LPS translocon maturation chaperone LptM [Rheinheimera sp. SA_1]|uniref:LPS translocon maturation chaperone LptM n=1 Tax=Rheinheimera sp. SA_1 TaxID=1827365 RepID=UPI0018D427F9|nr:lipoprotein [Rheinheimera sp. SA_1]
MQTLFVLMLASLGLTGCGQKGDLFLPTTPPPVATPAEPAAKPAPKAIDQQPEPTQPEQQQPTTAGTASPDTSQQAQHSNRDTKR